MLLRAINAAASAIHQEFGDGYEIYVDTIEQGLKTPCFLIETVQPTQEQFRNNRYFRKTPICVHYLSREENSRSDNRAVVERLYVCLDRITIKDVDMEKTVKGREMHYEETDNDALHFFVVYDQFVDYPAEKAPAFETLKTDMQSKGQ